MGKVFDRIEDKLRTFMGAQKMFFVATAPLSGDGLVNCSPKGGDGFRVLGDREVAYQDLTGSGVETIAHVRENSRIVIMFCAFEGRPNIVRLHGKAEVITKGHARYPAIALHFEPHPGTRAFIRVDVERISDSCGYSVPLYDFVGHRDVLDKWTDRKGDDGLKAYRNDKNTKSIDGLPGLDPVLP